MGKISQPILFFAAVLMLMMSATSRGDQKHPELDPLFDALKQESDLVRIAELQNQIWALWYELPADQQHLQATFDEGMRALSLAMPQTAIEHFTQVIKAAPEFAEAWNRRATTFFMIGDLESSMADIQKTLLLEPRHFGALSGLSMIFENSGDLSRAVAADRLMLELMPHHSQVQERIVGLEQQLYGLGI